MSNRTVNGGVSLGRILSEVPGGYKAKNGRDVSTQKKGGGSNVTPRVSNGNENSFLGQPLSSKNQLPQETKEMKDANTIKQQLEEINLKDIKIGDLTTRLALLEKALATEREQEVARKHQLETLKAQAEAARIQAETTKSQLEKVKQEKKELGEKNNELVEEAGKNLTRLEAEFEEELAEVTTKYEESQEAYKAQDERANKLAKDVMYHLGQQSKSQIEVERVKKLGDELKKELKEAKSLSAKYDNFIEIARPLLGLAGGVGAVYGVYDNPAMVSEVVGLFGRYVVSGATFEGFNQLLMGCGMEFVAMVVGYIGYVASTEIGPRAAILTSILSKAVNEILAWTRSSLMSVMFKYYNMSMLLTIGVILAYYNQIVNAIVAPYYTNFKWEMSLHRNDIVNVTIDGLVDLGRAIFEYFFGKANIA